MIPRIVPMLHVPDVSTTANWYTSIGFRILRTAEDGRGYHLGFTSRSGNGELMLNCGGAGSDAHRRDADLYIHVEDW